MRLHEGAARLRALDPFRHFLPHLPGGKQSINFITINYSNDFLAMQDTAQNDHFAMRITAQNDHTRNGGASVR